MVIKIYRPINGIRTPHNLTLDAQRNVVSEEIDRDELDKILGSPFLMERHRVDGAPSGLPDSALADMAKHGLNAHIQEDGGVLISPKPLDEFDRQFNRWATKGFANPYPGSEELREKFFSELELIKGQVARQECPACEINKHQGNYKGHLREFLQQHAARKHR